MMTLSQLPPGKTAKIIRVYTTGFLKRRLMDMGVICGVEVRVEKVAPLGDPIEIVLKGYRLSLRKGEAEKIDVEVLL